jgi:hypothetical protein
MTVSVTRSQPDALRLLWVSILWNPKEIPRLAVIT